MKLRELNSVNVAGFLAKDAKLTLLAFHSNWSKPARTMLPVLVELDQSYDGMVRFALVDADQAADLVDHYGVLTLPTYLVFKQGREVDRFTGLLTKEKLTERVERSLQTLQ